MKKTFILLLGFLTGLTGFSQNLSSSQIYHEIEKLRSPYRVLYLAAHPDDENTRLISYFANEEKARTAYLSLTRGDGGQNLIGKEKGALLGVLRSQELMAARRIDGGEQFFTRAVDFGYSKTSSETFEFWGKEEILGDVVYILRYFKPHIIINRFPAENYSGHGHHHASALLSRKAFEMAGDSTAYPDQISEVGVWSPTTLYLNSSTWWDKSLPERAKNDFSISTINIGKFNKNLGYSYNELAAFSRSQHKSQGFGSAPQRGDREEYLEFLAGEMAHGESLLINSALDSIDVAWVKLSPQIDSILNHFDHSRPYLIANALLDLRESAIELNADGRFDKKIESINSLVLQCLGVIAEVISDDEIVFRDQEIKIDLEIINRSVVNLNFKGIRCDSTYHSWNRPLEENKTFSDTLIVRFDSNNAFSTPYWLAKEYEYRFDHSQELLKKPVSNGLMCKVDFTLDDKEISVESPMIYKWTDRVKGGQKKNVALLPKNVASFEHPLYFPKDSVVNGRIYDRIALSESGTWEKKIEGVDIDNPTDHFDSKYFTTWTFPFKSQVKSKNPVMSILTKDGEQVNSLVEIEYDHIPYQTVLLPARSKVVPLNMLEESPKIAYVKGPDNEMISYLRELELNIQEFSQDDLLNGQLSDYDVLLFGIRSLNVDPSWNDHAEAIQAFMKSGGLVLMQYQTRGFNPKIISPYPFDISRKRVTDQNSSANISKKDHKVFNRPYEITRDDFDNWNQERGLYFADKWDENFETVVSWHDKDELDEFGSIIIGDYGKGAFIYTGVSFFRHIPYGVPGSYKLFVNLASYRQGK